MLFRSVLIKNKWITVTIDDRIPCCEKKWYDIPRPLYAQPHENEMYIILIKYNLSAIYNYHHKLIQSNKSIIYSKLL